MVSVFANHVSKVFTFRQVEIQFTSRIYGGVPLRPDVIEAWIRKGTGINQHQELAAVVKRTISELDPELAEAAKNMTPYELMKLASEKLATSQSSVGFKRDTNGLFIESRQIKAGLREATNILFAGERWGPTKKGPKSWLAERVFVGPERIYLGVPRADGSVGAVQTNGSGVELGVGVGLPQGDGETILSREELVSAQEPTDLDLFVGHVTGPQGPRSTLTYYQYVQEPRIRFIVAVVQNDVIEEHWADIWSLLENLGFGALRSQDAGRFETTKWEPAPPVPLAQLRPAYERDLAEKARADEADATVAATEEAIIAAARASAAAAGSGGRRR